MGVPIQHFGEQKDLLKKKKTKGKFLRWRGSAEKQAAWIDNTRKTRADWISFEMNPPPPQAGHVSAPIIL